MNQAVIRGLVIGGLLAAPAFAQKKIPPFSRPVELDAECLQFKTFAGAEATTVPPPRVFHATRTKDGSPVELFAPVQLWRAPQVLGYWQVPGGPGFFLTTLTTGPLELPAEQGVDRVILERPECDALLAKAPRVDPDDPASITAWLEFFSSGKLKGPLQSLPDTIVLKGVRTARVESKTETQAVLLFSVKPGMHGANPDRVYAAWVQLADKAASDEAVQAIARGFLPTVKPAGRPRAVVAKPVGKTGAAKAEESPDRVRSRETVLQTIRGLPKWWSLETERYILVSDLAGSERSFVKRLSDDLTRLCSVYEKLVPPQKKIEAVSAVRVFASGEDYVQYVGAAYAWTAGQWNPGRLELIIRSSNWMQGKAKKENIGEIVRHEALHQYFFYAFPGNSMSIWFNEGHATFLEGVELLPNGVRLSEVEQYARQVEGMAQAGSVPLQALLKMSPADFYKGGGTDLGRSRNYALAWSLVYFLRKGAPSDPEPKFAAILPKYEAALREGKSGEEATDIAFKDIYPEALETAWRAFWNSDSRRGVAKRLDLFAAAP